MDINLPGINGFKALKSCVQIRQRRTSRCCHQCQCHASRYRKGAGAGFFSRYLTKPIKVNEFMNALDDAAEKFSKTEPVDANKPDKHDD